MPGTVRTRSVRNGAPEAPGSLAGGSVRPERDGSTIGLGLTLSGDTAEGPADGGPRSESPAAGRGGVEPCHVHPTLHSHHPGTICPLPSARSHPAATLHGFGQGTKCPHQPSPGIKFGVPHSPPHFTGVDGGQSVPQNGGWRSEHATGDGIGRPPPAEADSGPLRHLPLRDGVSPLYPWRRTSWADLSELPRRCSMRTPASCSLIWIGSIEITRSAGSPVNASGAPRGGPRARRSTRGARPVTIDACGSGSGAAAAGSGS